jgi:hypothetical protein
MPTENESIQYTDLDEANLEITNLRTKLAKSKEETAKKTKE